MTETHNEAASRKRPPLITRISCMSLAIATTQFNFNPGEKARPPRNQSSLLHALIAKFEAVRCPCPGALSISILFKYFKFLLLRSFLGLRETIKRENYFYCNLFMVFITWNK